MRELRVLEITFQQLDGRSLIPQTGRSGPSTFLRTRTAGNMETGESTQCVEDCRRPHQRFEDIQMRVSRTVHAADNISSHLGAERLGEWLLHLGIPGIMGHNARPSPVRNRFW